MRKRKPKSYNTHLRFSDAEAILCSLPLVEQIPADSPAQELRNSAAARSASEKLLAMIDRSVAPSRNIPNQVLLTPEEIRVVLTAIGFALDFISGVDTGFSFDVDSDHKKGLSKNYFVLNRLYPIFDDLVEKIEAELQQNPRP